MTETKPEYHTDQDSGDEDEHRPFGPTERTAYPGGGVYTRWVPGNVTAPEAVYWQAQAETAIRTAEQAAAERNAALQRIAELEPPPSDTHQDGIRWVSADLYGARRQDVEALQAQLQQAAAERDAALARVELLEDVAVTFMRRDLDTRKLYKRVNKVLRSAHDRLEPMIARLYQDSE